MDVDRFDRYEIRQELGSGAMGIVYRAWDTRLQRPVALKFLSPHLAAEESARRRFIKEARAASALDHPNIAVVYDAGEVEAGQVYIAMRYYPGATIEERLDEGPLSLEEAVDVARQVAEGLEVAHEAGIVHRDVKPGNVILSGDGVPKILDFGVAKMREAIDASHAGEGSSPGTPSYMAPEQIQGGEVDGRADLWALGVLIYEMISGRSCFPGRYQEAVFYAILHEEPTPLGELREDVPEELSGLVDELLSKDPDERPGEAREVADRLAVIGRGLRGAAEAPGSEGDGPAGSREAETAEAGFGEAGVGDVVREPVASGAGAEEEAAGRTAGEAGDPAERFPSGGTVRHRQVWEEILAPGERLLREFSVSDRWLRTWALGLGVAAAIILWNGEGGGSGTPAYVLFAWALGYFYYYVPRSRIYGLTDRRLVLRTGWWSPETTSISYSTIADIRVKEPYLRGKVFGTGRLLLTVEGRRRPLTVKHLEDPHELQRQIEERMR